MIQIMIFFHIFFMFSNNDLMNTYNDFFLNSISILITLFSICIIFIFYFNNSFFYV